MLSVEIINYNFIKLYHAKHKNVALASPVKVAIFLYVLLCTNFWIRKLYHFSITKIV